MNNARVKAANQMRAAHKQNIQRSLEHRLQVARSKGDLNLIKQLEAEIRYFQ